MEAFEDFTGPKPKGIIGKAIESLRPKEGVSIDVSHPRSERYYSRIDNQWFETFVRDLPIKPYKPIIIKPGKPIPDSERYVSSLDLENFEVFITPGSAERTKKEPASPRGNRKAIPLSEFHGSNYRYIVVPLQGSIGIHDSNLNLIAYYGHDMLRSSKNLDVIGYIGHRWLNKYYYGIPLLDKNENFLVGLKTIVNPNIFLLENILFYDRFGMRIGKTVCGNFPFNVVLGDRTIGSIDLISFSDKEEELHDAICSNYSLSLYVDCLGATQFEYQDNDSLILMGTTAFLADNSYLPGVSRLKYIRKRQCSCSRSY